MHDKFQKGKIIAKINCMKFFVLKIFLPNRNLTNNYSSVQHGCGKVNMSLVQYLQLTDRLPNPRLMLSVVLPSRAIAQPYHVTMCIVNKVESSRLYKHSTFNQEKLP